MLKIREEHLSGKKLPWKNGMITYNKHLGWIYHEKDAKIDTVIYAYLLRDIKKIFPNVKD